MVQVRMIVPCGSLANITYMNRTAAHLVNEHISYAQQCLMRTYLMLLKK